LISWLLIKEFLIIFLLLTLHFHSVIQYFSTFWDSQQPLRPKKIWRHPIMPKRAIWGTVSSKTLKKTHNSIFGGTPSTSSRHPCVPRHPGSESMAVIKLHQILSNLSLLLGYNKVRLFFWFIINTIILPNKMRKEFLRK